MVHVNWILCFVVLVLNGYDIILQFGSIRTRYLRFVGVVCKSRPKVIRLRFGGH